MHIELLLNPFCLADFHYERMKSFCDKNHIELEVYNPWNIDDDSLGDLPEHIRRTLRQLRNGELFGSMYPTLFVNNEKMVFDNVDQVEGRLYAMISKEPE